MKANIKSKIIAALLFCFSFFINFKIGIRTFGTEDFTHAISGFAFLEGFDVRLLMYEPHNSMDFITLPFYFIFDPSYTTLRAVQAIFLGMSVVFFFLFSKKYFKSETKALLASVFLISVPHFTLTVYHPEYPFLALFSTLTLYLLESIESKNNLKKILLLGFVIGIASFRKAIFLPYGILVVVAYLINQEKSLKNKFAGKNKGYLLAGFFLGFLPFLLSLLNSRGDGFLIISSVFQSIPKMIQGVIIRITQLGELFLSPSRIYGSELALSNLAFFNILILLFSFGYLLVKKEEDFVFGLVPLAFSFIASIQLINNKYSTTHLYILLPILTVILISGLFKFSESFFSNKPRKATLFPILIILVLILINGINSFNVYKSVDHKQAYEKEDQIAKVISDHNFDAIYDLTRLEKYPYWNMRIPFYTKGDVNYGSLDEEQVKNRIIAHWYWEKMKEKKYPTEFSKIMEESRANENLLFLSVENLDQKSSNLYDNKKINNKLGENYFKIKVHDQINRVNLLFWLYENDRNKELKNKIKPH